jgi:hypothetical protein
MRTAAATLLAFALLAPTADAKKRAPTVPSTLAAMEHAGKLTHDQRTTYARLWSRSKRAVRHLRGSARWNFDGVLDNTNSLARRRLLDDRVVPAFLTLQRNYEWFWAERRGTATYGARRSFGDSPVIFQFYPGSGWQIQVLGNFGRLNGLARSRHTKLADLTRFADDLLALAVKRSRFLTLEYYFPWDGGAPGWVSGMATATGAQALSRVWKRTHDDRYRDAAEQMLGAFFTSPPRGVRVRRSSARAHYLLYSQSPREFVGNGFAQTLIALDEVERTIGGTRARVALERGLNQADVEMPRYDTGAWSLYWHKPGSRHGAESDLHYHELFTGFLKKLCRRFPDRGDFCGLHDRFVAYESQPVELGPLHARRHGRSLSVRVRVSKRGSGKLLLLRGARVVARGSSELRRGTRTLRLTLPRRHGTYTLRLDAVSLNGVESSRSRTLRLR